MSFARPRQPTSRSQVKSKPSKNLSYRNPPSQNTAAFKSTGKTFDFHNPKRNAAPVELQGNMIHRVAAKHAPASWEALLSSSKTFYDHKPTKAAFEARKIEQKKAARTICPELQDEPPIISPRRRNPLRSFIEASHPKGITGCERKHDPRMYRETVQLPFKKCASTAAMNASADARMIQQMFKERNVDRIGSPTGVQIKDSARSTSFRPYPFFGHFPFTKSHLQVA